MATREEVEAVAVARALQVLGNLSEQSLQELGPSPVSLEVVVTLGPGRPNPDGPPLTGYDQMRTLSNEVLERLYRLAALCLPPLPPPSFVTRGISPGDVVSIEDVYPGAFSVGSSTAVVEHNNVTFVPRNATPPKPIPEPPNVWERLTREED